MVTTQTWTELPVVTTETVSVAAASDIVAVRHAVRRRALEVHLSLVDQTKIVIAEADLSCQHSSE